MRLAKSLLAMFLTMFVFAPCALGYERLTENTYRLGPSEASPPARIEDMAWLAGHWVGEGLGGVSEEVWSTPRGGAMMGAYRLVKDDEPAFYEMLTIMEEGGSLVFRLKHFDADLTAWEEKEETVDFPLVALEETAVHFEGLSFHRQGGELTIYLALHQDDGSVREAVFTHEKVRAESPREGQYR